MSIHFDDDSFFEFTQSGDGQFSEHKVLVEGDSWAAHPQLVHLAHQLDRVEKNDHAILSLAHSGDTAVDMFEKDSAQFRRFKRAVKSKEFGFKFSLVLLSAGGNDIVGPEMTYFLLDKAANPSLKDAQLIDKKKFDKALADINKCYKNALNVLSKSTINKDVPIIAHTYSYLQPRRVGTHLGPITFSEGWIAKYMEEDKNIFDPEEQEKIIKSMLKQFSVSLATLQKDFGNFLVVDTLNVLMKDKKPDVSLFHDEIHPNRTGFKKVMSRIKSVAKKKGFWIA
jgi:hypothetical protein